MSTWTIFDSQVTPLLGFDLAWLPEQAATYVTPHITRQADHEAVALEVGPYVGALPLTNGDTLYITPRVGQQTLSYMLMVTGRLENAVQREFEQLANLGYSTQNSVSWVHLLARSFLDHLRLIEKGSLRFDRKRVSERRQTASGQLDMVPTLISLRRRETIPVHCVVRTRTYETVEHRMLGAAANILLSLRAVEVDNLAIARRWTKYLGDGPLTNQELRDVARSLSAGHYTGPRSYYIKALVMAQLILAQGGVTLDDAATVRSEALLTNVYTLFESYVRITLRNHLTKQGYVVEKLDSGAPTLFVDGTSELKPDVIISDRTGVRLLVDAKYKLREDIGAADYYQMATYLKGYQVQHGVIVRPRVKTLSTPLISRRMNYGGWISELNIGLSDTSSADNALCDGITRALTAAAAAVAR